MSICQRSLVPPSFQISGSPVSRDVPSCWGPRQLSQPRTSAEAVAAARLPIRRRTGVTIAINGETVVFRTSPLYLSLLNSEQLGPLTPRPPLPEFPYAQRAPGSAGEGGK